MDFETGNRRSTSRPGRFVSVCLEVRTYRLKAGQRAAFESVFLEQALPMLHRWKTDVVSYGPSLHDDDSYYLMRAYPSLEARERDQAAFYGSAEWLEGPKDAILSHIDSYVTVVLDIDERTVEGLRRAMASA